MRARACTFVGEAIKRQDVRVYQKEDKPKTAQVMIIRSLKLGFVRAGYFLEKCEIYFAAVRLFHRMQNARVLVQLEHLMLKIASEKVTWKDTDEMMMAMNIYVVVYQTRYDDATRRPATFVRSLSRRENIIRSILLRETETG